MEHPGDHRKAVNYRLKPQGEGHRFTMDEVCNALGMTEAEVLDGLKAAGNGPVTISTIVGL